MSVAARPPAFVNDLETCVGCHACAVACANENQLTPGTSWRQIVTVNEARRAGVPTLHLSLACNHCRDAPCMRACPAVAISRDARTGAVLIDAGRCVGCRYCSWVCPYDAPRFDEGAGVMRKCTLCNDRLLDGLAPACVVGCPVGALQVGAPVVDEPTGVPGFPAGSIGPAIRFLPVRSRTASAGAIGRDAPVLLEWAAGPPPKISARSEWALVAFTFVAQVLVGLVLAAAFTPLRVGAWPVALAGLAAIGVSTMHLGQPLRAWRAALNVRRSWLSREVVSWSAFLGIGTAALAFAEPGSALRWMGAGVGLICLACVDRVYVAMARAGANRLDDVSAMTGGMYLGAVFAGWAWVATALAVWRLAAYMRRARRSRAHIAGGRHASAERRPIAWWARRRHPRLASWVAPVRVGLMAASLALLALGGDGAVGVMAAASAAVGELVDRLVFYDTLDITTPRHAAARESLPE